MVQLWPACARLWEEDEVWLHLEEEGELEAEARSLIEQYLSWVLVLVLEEPCEDLQQADLLLQRAVVAMIQWCVELV